MNPSIADMTREQFVGGTVSHGTMRSEDLIPAFLATAWEMIGTLKADSHNLIPVRRNTTEMLADITKRSAGKHYYADTNRESVGSDLEFLFDTLDAFAPSGWHFGAHEADGSDFGFWRNDNEGSV